MFALLDNKKTSMFASMFIDIDVIRWFDSGKNTIYKRENQTYNKQMRNGKQGFCHKHSPHNVSHDHNDKKGCHG